MKSQKLRQAKALIADPNHWTQGRFVSGRGGKKVAYCAVGAVRELFTFDHHRTSSKDNKEYSSILVLLTKGTQKATNGAFGSIIDLNDSGMRSAHELVMRSYDEAIKIAEERELNSISPPLFR